MGYGMSSLLDLLTGPRSALSPVPPAASPLGTQIQAYRPADKDACIEGRDGLTAALMVIDAPEQLATLSRPIAGSCRRCL